MHRKWAPDGQKLGRMSFFWVTKLYNSNSHKGWNKIQFSISIQMPMTMIFSYLYSSARLTTQPTNCPPNRHHVRTAESWFICHLPWSWQKAGCDHVLYLTTVSHRWTAIHGQTSVWCFLRVLIYWPGAVTNRGSTHKLSQNWSGVRSWMEWTIKRTDLVLEEGKWIAGQKAGGQAGEKSYIIFFKKAEGMASTKWPHTETGKRQYTDKKNHSIILFFQTTKNKTKDWWLFTKIASSCENLLFIIYLSTVKTRSLLI